MTSLSTDFTEKLFADYEANAKYGAIENAVTITACLNLSRHVNQKWKMILFSQLI